ncbi:MAG: ABC transporter transmembrane domain-containing protein [Bdellovibrionota bacterium]
MTREKAKVSGVNVYRRLLSYLRPYRGQFLLALLAMSLYGATDGAVPYILKRVLDDIFGARNEGMLWNLVYLILGFAVIRGLFGFLERYLIASVGLSIVRDLRNEIGQHLLRLSTSFYSRETSGALVSRMTNDTLLVRSALTDAAGSILRDSVRIAALAGMAIYLDPVLGLIAFIGFPLGIYPVMRFGKKVRRFSRMGQDRFGGLTALLQEMIVGHRVVQAFAREDHEYQRFKEENEKITDTFKRAEKYGAFAGPTNEVLASLAIAAVILYGGFSVISGVRTQGDFIAFITSMFLMYEPLKKLGRMNTITQAGVAAAERIFELLDTVPEIQDLPGARPLVADRPEIEYRHVSFQYPSTERSGTEAIVSLDDAKQRPYALHDFSLKVSSGETVALVGMSGGGKSTVISLLPRFYDPTSGEIRIAGSDIREYTLASLRSSMSIVNQHTFLFNQTVYDNIAYGDGTASREQIIEAAKAANAHTFIERLPEGYDTQIGEQGLRLSGGERARIAIARALLKNAPILILDEATASLDSESEHLVQRAIDRLMENRTTLVIAHRLSTIRKANRIAVLKQGRLVELGSHEELLAANGEYSKLHRLQFQQAETESRQLSAGGAA